MNPTETDRPTQFDTELGNHYLYLVRAWADPNGRDLYIDMYNWPHTPHSNADRVVCLDFSQMDRLAQEWLRWRSATHDGDA